MIISFKREKVYQIIVLFTSLIIFAIFSAGCSLQPGTSTTFPKKGATPDLTATNIEQVSYLDGLTPAQRAILSSNIFEGIVEKIDPTWLDKRDVNDQKFVTDFIIVVTKTYKGPILDGKEIIVRNKQRISSLKNEDLYKIKFDSRVLFYLLKEKERFATTTGEFSDLFILDMVLIEDENNAVYNKSVAAIEEVAGYDRNKKTQEVKDLPVNKSILNMLLSS